LPTALLAIYPEHPWSVIKFTGDTDTQWEDPESIKKYLKVMENKLNIRMYDGRREDKKKGEKSRIRKTEGRGENGGKRMIELLFLSNIEKRISGRMVLHFLDNGHATRGRGTCKKIRRDFRCLGHPISRYAN
jgi:hypothetical protein